VSEGRPDALNRLTRYSTVQEQPVPWGATIGTMTWMTYNATSPNPGVRLVFTDVSLPAGPRAFIDNIARGAAGITEISHSQMRGVFLDVTATLGGTTVALTNILFDRCTAQWVVPSGASYLPFTLTPYNNLFRLGAATFANNNTTYSYSWTVRDNLFDSDTLQQSGINPPTASHNGYRNGLSSLGGTGNRTGLVMDYVPGPATNWLGVRGGFYYPTSGSSTSLVNLVDVGNRTGAAASLFHFTTRAASGTTEANTQVDVGYHYVGVSSAGTALDTDGDQAPNYLEDTDGDGVQDTNETSLTGAELHRTAGVLEQVARNRGIRSFSQSNARQPRTIIGMFMGSWFGDWNLSINNFLRSFLGVPDYGLAAMWARDHWPMTEFPLGRSLGELQQFANDYFLFQDGRVPTAAAPKRWFCILGDPALRYPAMSPVQRFAGTRVGSDISLNWDPVSAATARYFVFRAFTTTLGPYTLISDTNGLTSTVFLDSGVPGTPVHYQLRSSDLAASGSGTYWNPGQSVTITVP